MKELLDFLNGGECEIRIGWINKFTFGAVDLQDNIIMINLALMIADIYIHEFLHIKYPFATEKEILAKTSKKLNRLTVKQIQDLAVGVMEVNNGNRPKT